MGGGLEQGAILVAQDIAVADLAIIGGRPADAEIVELPAQRALRAIFEAAVAQVAAQVVGHRAVDPFETDLLLQDVGAVIEQVEADGDAERVRSEAHTSELQLLMRISYAALCLKQTMTE